jgi:hypothetical protein
VSHLHACHHSAKLTTLIAVLFPSDKLLDDPQAAVVELQDYDTVEEAISLSSPHNDLIGDDSEFVVLDETSEKE